MERIYHLIVQKPKTILFLLFLLTSFFAYHARHIRLDSSIESLLPQNDPANQYYAEVRQLFGSDEIGVIGLITDTVYTPEVLQKIARLTEEIQKVDGVENVLSLTNAVDPIADVVEPPLLIPQIPSSSADLEDLRKKLADRPIYLKNLVSPDGRAAAINIFFTNMDNDEFMRRGIDDTIREIVERERGPEQLYYTGLPHFKVYATRAMWEDLTLFVPLTLLIIMGVLFLSFRSLRGVLLPTVIVLVSLIWTLGIMVLAGSSLSIGSIALPPLVLVLGTAYSLHIVAEYYELAHPGRSVSEVVIETLRTTTPPLFIAAFTTVLGFLSLGVNTIVSIRELGIYASVGISIAFIFSVVLGPAFLALLRLPTRREENFSPGLRVTLRTICQLSIRHRGVVIVLGLLISALSLWQTFSIQVDSNFQSFFRERDPIRQATDAINRHLTGSMAFYVVIDSPEPDRMKQWDTLRRMKDLQLYIDSLPGVDKTVSFVDYCEMLDRGAQQGGGDEILVSPEGEIVESLPQGEQTTFWDNPAQLGAVMQLVAGSPKSFSLVVSPDFSRANMIVRTTLSRSSDIAATVDRIQQYARERFPPELKVQATGNLILLTRTTGDIISGQIESLALTAGVIFILMAAMFLSVRVGIIAMVPNLFPILVFFGLMGVSGAVLNFGTNIIAAIALGIAVDSTIHLMTRLSSAVRETANQEEALLRTLSTVGKPALYASFVLFLGFLALSFSTFVPIQEFGLLSAATMVVALIGDIVLLPALLATTPIITLWDLLYLKLGRDPHRTIPLFAGLRPLQAKIVTLMGQLKAFSHGQPIIREGEVGNEMFVIIKGTADVFIRSRYVRTLGRGEVFGEMGLIRHHERTADVIAAEDVEVIAVNERFLSRMQRRYPRIGAKIFLNIARILSDRLQDVQRPAA
jgi:predicted RND superfamily exporter protein